MPTSPSSPHRTVCQPRSHASRLAAIRTGGRPLAGHLETLFPNGHRRAPIVTVMDGASHSLSFLGGAFGAPVIPLGSDTFGQSGTLPDLYATMGIDSCAHRRGRPAGDRSRARRGLSAAIIATMRAGAAKVDITPELPVDVLGYVRRDIAPRRAIDPLMATCRGAR